MNQIIRLFKNYTSDNQLFELLKGSSISLIIRLIGVISNYGFTLIISNLYGASALGLFAISQTSLFITSIISRLGFDTASVKFVSENYFNKNYNNLRSIYFKILKMVASFSIIISILFYFTSPYFAKLANKPAVESMFKVSSFFILPFALLFIHSESFRGMKKILYYSLFRNMTIPFFSTTILIFLYYINYKSIYVPLYSYLASIIILSVIAFLLWINRLPKIDNNLKADKFSSLKLLHVSYPMMITSSMNYVLNWIGIFVLAIYNTDWEIGIYDVATKVSLITSLSLFSINSIAAPKFAELFSKNNMNLLQEVVSKSSKLIFWTSFPVIVCIFLFSNQILSLFGNDFIYGKYALLFLCFGQFINSLSGSVGYILQMTGHQKIFQNVMFISMLFNLILNFILIPKFGINGAAIASSSSIIILNISSIIMVKRKLNIFTMYIPGYNYKINE